MRILAIMIAGLIACTAAAQDAPTVYQFDKQGIYQGEAKSPESPLEPGVYYDPENSTRTAPPSPREGFALKLDGDAWGYVEDHGGKTVYTKADGRPVTLTNFPDDADGYSYGPIPDVFTATEKPGEFYEWDDKQSTWVENTAKKDEVAQEIARKSKILQDEATANLREKIEDASLEQIKGYVDGTFPNLNAEQRKVILGLILLSVQ